MIDVHSVVYDEAAQAILTEYPEAYISSVPMVAPASFPAVELRILSNVEIKTYMDSSGEENVNEYIVQAQIYDNDLDESDQVCWNIAQIIDSTLRKMNARRSFLQALDNAADPDIYRLTGRWIGAIDSNGLLYWR